MNHLALAIQISGQSAGTLVGTYKEPVTGLAWAKGGRLLIATDANVYEWPTGRSVALPRSSLSSNSPSPDSKTVFALNASKTRALGPGFILDIRTLKVRPFTVQSKDYMSYASWESDNIVETHSDIDGHFALVHNGNRVPVAKGWYVLGVSRDHRYAMATRKALFDGDTTYLLRLNPRTGAATKVEEYPKSSDDHLALNSAEANPTTGKLLFHRTFLPADNQHPFFRPVREPLDFPTPKHVTPTNERLDWIPGSSSWLTLSRQLFFEAPPYGFDVTTLDLWNYRTGALVRVYKKTFGWGPGKGRVADRGVAPQIGPYAVNSSRQIAYAVIEPTRARVYVMKFKE